MSEQILISYPEAVNLGSFIVGGKGWNLGRLDRYGFKVPAGFIISANLYHDFINNPEIKSNIDKLNTYDKFDENNHEIIALIELIKQKIMEINFNESLISELELYLKKHDLFSASLAIRSSATAEDGNEASFAGIHSSFLNISGLDNIITAIKKCYASLWTLQALSYRKNKNLSDFEVNCAVVICKMVKNSSGEPESAGVLFTADPLTGRRDQFKINVTRGLAEKLVSGHINPEEITVTYEALTKKITRNGNEKILTDEQVEKLFRIADRIYWALGNGQHPQDIEWAFDGKDFWIVQSRPITNLPYPTFEELKALPIIWTNGNFKDAIPGVMSTFSQSSLQTTIRLIMYESLKCINFEIPEGLEITRIFSGRMYFDLSFMQRGFYTAFGVTPFETNISLGSEQIEIPAEKLSLSQRLAINSNNQKLLKVLKKEMKKLEQEIKTSYDLAKRFKTYDFSQYSKPELTKLLYEILIFAYNFAPLFQLGNLNAGVGQSILQMLLKKLAPNDLIELSSGLMVASGEIISAEQGYKIYDLAKIALKDPEANTYFNQKIFMAENWKNLEKKSPFIIELNKYLAVFGHRAVYEGEILNPRWNENPEFIIQQVREIILLGDITDPRQKALEVRQKAEAKLKNLFFLFRPLVKHFAQKARASSALREASKSALSALFEPIRLIVIEIGRRLYEEQIIDKPEDIFSFTLADLYCYLFDGWDGTGAKNLVADRIKQNNLWKQENPTDTIITDKDGKLVNFDFGQASLSPLKKSEVIKGKVISGIPVSGGIAKGKVRIIHHPSEGIKLEKGDILVTPSTDPSWTPLFLRASAIVMEVGGYLSHGAIVSREYGLPAVVNIPHILELLSDGQVITVNGNKGEIIIESIE